MFSSRAETRVLADRWLAGHGLLANAARIFAANILLVLCARIMVPLPWTPVPITGQTFGVLLVAVLLGARRSALVMGLYLLEGLLGAPVFAQISLPGPAYFLGPTAGYLLSYPIAAFVTGWLIERRPFSRGAAATLRLLGALLAGELVIFTVGCTWLAAFMQKGWLWSLGAGAAPFMPGEVLKLALILAAVRGVEIASRKE